MVANLKSYNRRLETNEQAIRLLHPNATLRRGFAIVLKDGKAIRSQSELQRGDRLVAQFVDGSVSAVPLRAGRQTQHGEAAVRR